MDTKEIRKQLEDLMPRLKTLSEDLARLDDPTESDPVWDGEIAFGTDVEIHPIDYPITLETLSDGFAATEKHDVRVAAVVMNYEDYKVLTKTPHEHLEIRAKGKKKGHLATLWGADIFVDSKKIPEGRVYIVGDDGKHIVQDYQEATSL